MFFIGIFGAETKEAPVKDIQNIVCKSCGSLSSYTLKKTYNFFHFFFIPLFKWNARYYAVSRCCRSIFEVSKEAGERLEKSDDNFIDDNDLTPFNAHQRGVCPNCRAQLPNDYFYCPYCGNKTN